MWADHLCSNPSRLQPSTNRRMYRFDNKGEIGAPWGVPNPPNLSLSPCKSEKDEV